MLTQKEFKTQVETIIKERYPLFKIEEVKKNNEVLTGITMYQTEKEECVPVIYIEHMYERYIHNMDLSISCFLDMYIREGMKRYDTYKNFTIDSYLTREYIFNNTIPQLIGYEKNAEYIREKNIPYYRWNDLAVIPRLINIEFEEDGKGSLILTHNMLNFLNISLDELWEQVNRNASYSDYDTYYVDELITPYKSSSIYCVLGMEEYGANVLLVPHIFGSIADSIQDDLYIFPVSVTEGIFVLPVKHWNHKDANQMLHTAYECALATSPKYALTKTIYKYERSTEKITMLNV